MKNRIHVLFDAVSDLVDCEEITWEFAEREASRVLLRLIDGNPRVSGMESVDSPGVCLYALHTTAPLHDLDDAFLLLSEEAAAAGLGGICAIDFTAMRTQGYEDGDYDTGSISDGGPSYSELAERLRKFLNIELPGMESSEFAGECDESDFMSSETFAALFQARLNDSAGLRPEPDADESVIWTCFLCGSENEYLYFEGGMCDDCFRSQAQRWASATGRTLVAGFADADLL